MIDASHFLPTGRSSRERAWIRDVARRYGFALSAFAAALAIRLLLDPLVGQRPVLVLFVSAVLLTAIFAGFGPALLGTGLVLLYDATLKLVNNHFQPADLINTLAFCLIVLEVYWVADRLRRTEERVVQKGEELFREQEHFRSFIDTVPEGVILSDEEGTIVETNAATARLFGYWPRRLAGNHISAVIPELVSLEGRLLFQSAGQIEPIADQTVISVMGRPPVGSDIELHLRVRLNYSKSGRFYAFYFELPGAVSGLGDTPAVGADEVTTPGDRVLARDDGLPGRRVPITVRERQVLERLLDGKSNRIIGEELAISPRTVERHRANLMTKLGAGNLTELIRMVMKVEAAASALPGNQVRGHWPPLAGP